MKHTKKSVYEHMEMITISIEPQEFESKMSNKKYSIRSLLCPTYMT